VQPSTSSTVSGRVDSSQRSKPGVHVEEAHLGRLLYVAVPVVVAEVHVARREDDVLGHGAERLEESERQLVEHPAAALVAGEVRRLDEEHAAALGGVQRRHDPGRACAGDDRVIPLGRWAGEGLGQELLLPCSDGFRLVVFYRVPVILLPASSPC
jgi:hypothetical protein